MPSNRPNHNDKTSSPPLNDTATGPVELFKHALDAAPNGVIIIDVRAPNHPIIYVNNAYLEMTGATREEILGQDSLTLFAKDRDQSSVREINTAIRRKKPANVNLRSVTKNGQVYWHELNITPLLNERQELTHFLGMTADVTQHKLAKDDLLRIQRAVETSSDAIVIWTTDGTPYYWNIAMKALAGESDPTTRLNPKHPNSIYTDQMAMREVFSKLAQGQNWSGEIRITTPQNKVMVMWLNADAIQDAESEIIGLVGVHIDITHRTQTLEIQRLLSKLGENLNTASSPHDAARMIAQVAGELFIWDSCSISLYDEERDRLIEILTMDTDNGRRREYPPDPSTPRQPSAFYKSIIAKGPLIIEKKDLKYEPQFTHFGNTARHSESLMFVPIQLTQPQMTGLITFQSYTSHAYTSGNLQSLQTLAEYCRSALQRCITEAEIKNVAHKLEMLNSISLIAVSCTTPTELSGSIAQELRKYFQMDSFFIDGFLPDSHMGIGFGNFDTIGGRFMRVPESPEPYDWLEMPMGQTLFIEKKPILLLRAPEELRQLKPSDLWWPPESPRSASLMFIPMLSGEKVTGILSLQSYQLNAYTSEHLEQLVSIGRQIAPVVEGLLLNQQLRDRNKAMLESNERFQMVCRATNDGVYDWNPVTSQVWRNNQYCRLFQLTPAEATDVFWWRKNIHPDDWPEVESGLRSAKTRGAERWSCVYRLRRADGQYLTVDDRAFIDHDAEGQPVRIIGAITDITERRHAELEIRRLAAFPNENPHPVVESSMDGEILYMNPAIESLIAELGCTAADLLPSEHKAIIKMCLAEHEPLMNVEEERAGRFMRWNYYPVAVQKTVHIYGMDVTEQRRQYAALIESEQRFRTLADAAPAIIWMADAAKKIIYANQTWSEFFGKGAAVNSMDAWLDRVHTDDRDRIRQLIDNAYGRREEFHMECRMRHEDSTWRWLMHSGRPRVAFDGAFLGFIGTSVDITERREMDEILRQFIEATSAVTGRDYFKALALQLTKTMNCQYAMMGEIVGGSDGKIQSLAFAHGGEILDNMTYALDGSPCAETVEQTICVYPSGVRKNFPGAKCLHDLKVESYVGCAIFDSHGQKIGVLSVMDTRPMIHSNLIRSILRIFAGRAGAELERIRARERELMLEEQFRHAQKLESLGILAGGIAHDFNNLLSGILGNASLAIMELPADSSALPLLKNLETSAMRAADLTQQMLAYSGRGQFIVKQINVNDLISEMADLIRVSINKNAVLVKRLSPAPLIIMADATQIRQVVMNLITNASEAIGNRPGEILISTEVVSEMEPANQQIYQSETPPSGAYVCLTVSDNGSGMNDATLNKIFDPFFTTKHTGRGLGLAATLGIVRGHNGYIHVTSRAGDGTTFKIYLPLVEAAPRIDTPPPAPEHHTSTQGQGLILVVDDEPPVRQIVKISLQKFGYSVVTANDGAEAIEIFKARNRELKAVIVDMTMPGLTGAQTIDEMRAVNAAVPAILMSGFNEQDLAEKMKNTTFDAFLQKPFRPQDVAAAVSKVMK